MEYYMGNFYKVFEISQRKDSQYFSTIWEMTYMVKLKARHSKDESQGLTRARNMKKLGNGRRKDIEQEGIQDEGCVGEAGLYYMCLDAKNREQILLIKRICQESPSKYFREFIY